MTAVVNGFARCSLRRSHRPVNGHRLLINGILWVLRTGGPRRCLPERCGSCKAVSSHFYQW
jgi:transposase